MSSALEIIERPTSPEREDSPAQARRQFLQVIRETHKALAGSCQLVAALSRAVIVLRAIGVHKVAKAIKLKPVRALRTQRGAGPSGIEAGHLLRGNAYLCATLCGPSRFVVAV